MTASNTQSSSPWERVAKRVLIYSADYLNFLGEYNPGGRQRVIRDLALVIKKWGRDVLVVQKGVVDFERICPDGIPVFGIEAGLGSVGDIGFARRARALARKGDVWLYASGEDAWPYHAKNSKAIQHGVWWDGPQSLTVRYIQKCRAMGMMRDVKSVLCVDTNFINWLRCQGEEGYRLCSKCHYIPNYVDLSRLPVTLRKRDERFSIIAARRFEEKRGTLILLNALALLRDRGVDFEARICTVGGVEKLRARVGELGLAEYVVVTEESMDSVLELYKDFHVAVVPTLWSEGTSLAGVEAIAAGLPVVCSPVGGLGNLVIPGFNGLITNPDGRSIANSLQYLSLADNWERMSEHCLSMRNTFGLDRWSDSVLPWLRS